MSTLARTVFSQDRVHPAAAEKVSKFHSEVVAQVRGLIEQHALVVVGMTMNPFPARARKLLDQQGIEYEYLGLGSYLSQWRIRLALKMWTGWPTFPMIFVKGSLIGGFTELQRLVESGELQRLLAA